MTYKLEDMLCDCTVIRTTFETLNLFPADDLIREEMREIINDARANLCRRCAELCADITNIDVLDKPLGKQEFSRILRTLLSVGYPRRNMDSCMKLNVFQSIAKIEAGENEIDPLYRYELLIPLTVSAAVAMSAETLTVTIFDDLRQSMESAANYTNKYAFDRNIFQKYVAIMFACYATTDSFFYS